MKSGHSAQTPSVSGDFDALTPSGAAEFPSAPARREVDALDGVRPPTRTVWCEDALDWLERHRPLTGCSLVTSLPDVSGLPGLGLDGWRRWFVAAAERVLAATPDDGISIFYQTDIKVDGTWIDKSYLCHRAAEANGAALLWHRVVCRKPAGAANFGRPAYTHLLCYSRGVRDRGARAYPDVLPAAGEMTWSQAMGVEACRLCCDYVISHTRTRTVVDPFCGVGTLLAVANAMGLDAVGVEIVRKRARRARALTLPVRGMDESQSPSRG
jgi:hypothetical protein